MNILSKFQLPSSYGLGFIILLKLSHLLHYFCVTRKLVKKSVLKEKQKAKISQEKLELAPVERILVPAL